MPVNYPELRGQLKNAGKVLRAQRETVIKAADYYEAALRTEAVSADLKERVQEAIRCKPDLRCAIPETEAIDSAIPLPETVNIQTRLFACDGSQISPSRHDEISFGLINTAVVEYVSNSGQAPVIRTRTKLLDFNNLPSEEQLGVQRDAEEKLFLAECAAASAQDIPTFAFCDGPLELFNAMPETPDYRDSFRKYLDALNRLMEADVPPVGYIDRPRSDPVLKMLDLLKKGDSEKSTATDSTLFSRLLKPGERSAVFGISSFNGIDPDDTVRICFFYLNIGRPGHPCISRVELPAWAIRPQTLDLIHRIISEQCSLLGSHPYPFILHRAHECAVVTMAEKEEVKGLLLRELAANGLEIPEKSNKQFAKDLMKNKK